MHLALGRGLGLLVRAGRTLAFALLISGVTSAPRARFADARVLERLTTSTGKHFAIPDLDASGIPNFAEIEVGLARGGQPTDEGIAYLRSHGYRTVIGLRSNDEERVKLTRVGIDYVEIPLRANLLGATPPTDDQIRQFLSIAMDSTRRPVFFHCIHGKDRTGSMAAMYRIEACGWTSEEAVEEMKAFGFHGYYRRLLRFVRAYARRGFAIRR